MQDIEDCIVFLFYEHCQLHPGDVHEEGFLYDLVEEARLLVKCQLEEEEAVEESVYVDCLVLFSLMYPCRTSFYAPLQPDFQEVLSELREQPKHEQRSAEWYERRNGMITASSGYKMFGSPCQQNTLIVEKCQAEKPRPPLSLYDARHWGVRYEPVSVQYYEHLNATVVEEFGCIAHRDYPFLGASPDGINVLEGSPAYGKMLEIKNPVSREITGSPTKEYFIQMQLQMEVCGINACMTGWEAWPA